MSEYNEKWEVVTGSAWFGIKDSTGDILSNRQLRRGVLCINACAGLGDVKVGLIAENYKGWRAKLESAEDVNKALKRDLADAVGLLEKECKNCYLKMGEVMDGHEIIDGPCAICPNKAFLTKHKRKGV